MPDENEANPTPDIPAAGGHHPSTGSPPIGLWLQWHGSGSPADPGEVSDLDVTWSRDVIYSADLRYISAQWMADQAAAYRAKEKAVRGDLKDPYRQMAWAFEFVLEAAGNDEMMSRTPNQKEP